jgi:hypothetical protein
MKTKYILPVLGLAASTMLTGCYDMDTTPLNQYITEDQKTEAKDQNPEIAQASITGITALFSTYCQVLTSYTGSTCHNDFGFPSIMLYTDCRGVDMVSEYIGYNWYGSCVRMDDGDNTSDGTVLIWNNCYKQIFAANAALKSIDAETEDPELQFYRAQALAIRAYDYLLLAQSYQFNYVGHESSPCVMIITEENETEAAENGVARSSVSEVYAQILSDLDSAIDLLSRSGVSPEDVLTSKPKRFVSLATAYGLRARANLVMNNWSAAAGDATSAIAAFNGRPASISEVSQPSFISLTDKNWMWGIAIAETDRVVTSGIINFPSMMGSLNYGYASVGAWRCINSQLFNQIPLTDVRRGWFLDGDGVSANLTDAQQTYISGEKAPAYTQVKFAPYGDELGTTVNSSDVMLMRIEEMYLIQAEATAMAGDAAQGAALLTQFVQQYRDPAYTCTATTAADVQEEVFQQRRVELWGEGLTTYDLMRLNKPFDRRNGGWAAEYTYNIPAGSNILIYVIPDVEANSNKLFTEADNNPSAGIPTPVENE